MKEKVKEDAPGVGLLPSSYTRRLPAWETISEEEWNDWKWQLKNAIRSVESLEKILPLTDKEKRTAQRVAEIYPIFISPHYLSLIDPEDPMDPIRLQSIPQEEEISIGKELAEDPLDEDVDAPVPGLTHRYPDRVLMVLTDFCSTYCRHCTRKRLFREDIPAKKAYPLEPMLDYLRTHKKIREVILSGGDPLTFTNSRLEEVLKKLRALPNIEIIRLGSRVPVTLPQRLYDEDLLRILERFGPIWCNTHFNHPREIVKECERAVRNLLRAGVPVNNQAVLLKGVNDHLETMKALLLGLLRIRVRPYYLFHCDPVRGTAHFRTSVWKGIELLEGLRGHISGLAIPTYVLDAPGGGGKIPLMPNYLLSASEDSIILRNYEGLIVKYYPVLPSEKMLRQHSFSLGVSELFYTDQNTLNPFRSPRIQRRKNGNSPCLQPEKRLF